MSEVSDLGYRSTLRVSLSRAGGHISKWGHDRLTEAHHRGDLAEIHRAVQFWSSCQRAMYSVWAHAERFR